MAGRAVGLLGGSFDPAHDGHLAISRAALARFALDRVWWLVSPGNPLKPDAPACADRRIARARAVAADPRIVVTDVERRLGTRTTADMLDALLPRYPGVRFVWLMGADNLAGFHRWDRWRDIAASVPIGVLARPGHALAALRGPAARTLAAHRLPAASSRLLPGRPAPAWCYVDLPRDGSSSSALRARGHWTR